MKALIVLIAILAGVWLWRSSRKPPAASEKPGGVKGMTACPVCGVHLPKVEAVKGKQALYCSADHRHQAEG